MCTQEMGQGRTDGDTVGAGDQEQVCFGNVGCPSVGDPWPLFPGGMPPPPLARVSNKEDFYLDDDDNDTRDLEGQ